MAAVKISVSEMMNQKEVYTKAIKNVRAVSETVKTASKSIGNDKMFDETRKQLSKMAELLELRAFVLEALLEAMNTAVSSYQSAQKHSVTVVSDFKSHKTDFYGNPVHVSGSVGAGGAQTINVTQNITNVTNTVNNYAAASSAEVPGSAGGVAATAPVQESVPVQTAASAAPDEAVSAPVYDSTPVETVAPVGSTGPSVLESPVSQASSVPTESFDQAVASGVESAKTVTPVSPAGHGDTITNNYYYNTPGGEVNIGAAAAVAAAAGALGAGAVLGAKELITGGKDRPEKTDKAYTSDKEDIVYTENAPFGRSAKDIEEENALKEAVKERIEEGEKIDAKLEEARKKLRAIEEEQAMILDAADGEEKEED